jgi:hypothetical protein
MTLSDAMVILARDFTEAIFKDPEATVSTPAWAKPRARVLDIVADEISGDETVLLPLLRLVVAASRGEDVKERAVVWIDARAREFADWHADDYITEDA